MCVLFSGTGERMTVLLRRRVNFLIESFPLRDSPSRSTRLIVDACRMIFSSYVMAYRRPKFDSILTFIFPSGDTISLESAARVKANVRPIRKEVNKNRIITRRDL